MENKKRMIENWFDTSVGLVEMEIIVSELKKRIPKMLEKTESVIEMYENDPMLKNAKHALEAQYKNRERIQKLFFKEERKQY